MPLDIGDYTFGGGGGGGGLINPPPRRLRPNPTYMPTIGPGLSYWLDNTLLSQIYGDYEQGQAFGGGGGGGAPAGGGYFGQLPFYGAPDPGDDLPFWMPPELPFIRPPTIPEPLEWGEAFAVPEAPDWWSGLTPNRFTPEAEYATILNAMLPFMSPDDQRAARTQLVELFPDAFGHYQDVDDEFLSPPVTPALRQEYLSSLRGESARNVLDRLANITQRSPEDEEAWRNQEAELRQKFLNARRDVIQEREDLRAAVDQKAAEIEDRDLRRAWRRQQYESIDSYVSNRLSQEEQRYQQQLQHRQDYPGEWGPGFRWLQGILGTLSDIGGSPDEPMTRMDYVRLAGAMEQMNEAIPTPYEGLGQDLLSPFFARGPLVPGYRREDGSFVFGQPNRAFF